MIYVINNYNGYLSLRPSPVFTNIYKTLKQLVEMTKRIPCSSYYMFCGNIDPIIGVKV